ncbi:hypothetical protein M5K25_026569 [Dendrobium thyrsiflorum]|uniref:Uncharacterized protein n=1 Tax=Dendrobium thyrsiflorum TaxID=117978 RepID=A0ABD0TY49_DENTH
MTFTVDTLIGWKGTGTNGIVSGVSIDCCCGNWEKGTFAFAVSLIILYFKFYVPMFTASGLCVRFLKTIVSEEEMRRSGFGMFPISQNCGPYVVVRQNSGPQVVVWRNSGPQVVIWQNSGPQVVVRHNFRPQVVVRHNSGLKWWSGVTPGVRWWCDRILGLKWGSVVTSSIRWWSSKIMALGGGLTDLRLVGRTIVSKGGHKDPSRLAMEVRKTVVRRQRSEGPQSAGDRGRNDRCLIMEVRRTIVGEGGWKDHSWQAMEVKVGVKGLFYYVTLCGSDPPGIDHPALGIGTIELQALNDGPTELWASHGGPAELRASSGGPVELQASDGGPTELWALGGGPIELWASSGGPTTFDLSEVVCPTELQALDSKLSFQMKDRVDATEVKKQRSQDLVDIV